MGKTILWFWCISAFIVSLIMYIDGQVIDMFTRIIFFSSLGVLAICESIEKVRK